MAAFVETGWLKGARVRTARKPHRCDYWRGLLSGGRCPRVIQPGEQYVEGERNDTAGGFGTDRYCLEHAQESAA